MILNEKVVVTDLKVKVIKKISLYKMSYYPETYTYNKNKIKVYLDLSNYAIKSDLKDEIGVNTSKCAK